MAKKCLTGHRRRVPEGENGKSYILPSQRHQRPRSEAEAAQTFFKVSKNAKFKYVVVVAPNTVSTAMFCRIWRANRSQDAHAMFAKYVLGLEGAPAEYWRNMEESAYVQYHPCLNLSM